MESLFYFAMAVISIIAFVLRMGMETEEANDEENEIELATPTNTGESNIDIMA